MWTGGGVAPAPDVPFTAGTARTLVGTGLTVTFDGPTLRGDGWTVSARPDAPTRVLPWALRDGMRAHGPRRHVAALAIVDLSTGEVHDCRERFRPLHKIRTCCTVTVGPPGTHVGDVDSIPAALDKLPPEGGMICLLAGEHPANVLVDTRRDVRFTGCPGRTTWVPKDPDEPLAAIADSMGVGFSDIEFRSGNAPAIVAGRWDPSDDSVEHGGLVVTDCAFVAPSGCAVLARALAGATLLRCRVQAGPFPQAIRLGGFASLPGVFLQGEDLVVERCLVQAGSEERMVPGRLALGGLHIGGDSRRVTIRDCHIEDGAGIGITLGSITFVKVNRDELDNDPELVLVEAVRRYAASGFGSLKYGWQGMLVGFLHVTRDAGCIGVEPVDPEPRGDDEVEVPVSEGMVEDVEILHNRVLGMGSSGIATYPFGLSPDGDIGDAVTVSRLLVADNLVADCVRFEVNVDDLDRQGVLPGGWDRPGRRARLRLPRQRDPAQRQRFRRRDLRHRDCVRRGRARRDNRIEDNGRYDPERAVTGPNSGVHLSAVKAGLGARAAARWPVAHTSPDDARQCRQPAGRPRPPGPRPGVGDGQRQPAGRREPQPPVHRAVAGDLPPDVRHGVALVGVRLRARPARPCSTSSAATRSTW